MPNHYNQTKWMRWNLATRDSGQLRYDFRPRVFLKTMRFEVALVCGGIFMGCMLPTLMKKSNNTRNTAQDPMKAFTKFEQSEEDRLRTEQDVHYYQ